jgi:hypothetical protein
MCEILTKDFHPGDSKGHYNYHQVWLSLNLPWQKEGFAIPHKPVRLHLARVFESEI